MREDCNLLKLLIFCVLYLIWGANARVYYKSISVLYNFPENYFDMLMDRGFGFLKGGELHFSMSCPTPEPFGRPEFWLLFCTTSEAREMTYKQLSTECLRPRDEGGELSRHNAYCKRLKVFHNVSNQQGQYLYYMQIEYDYFYTILLHQCPSLNLDHNNTDNAIRECQSTLLALNPGGVQLSSDEISLPLIYTVINLIWATLVAAWFFNWVIYFKYSNRLHRLISCAPIFKVILVVLILLWWQEIANTGMESRDISSVRHFVESIEDSLLFITMMIIAEGWGVVRCHIKHYRWTSLLLLSVIFAISLMCVNWVHRYFLAFSVCCVVFMMYKTLKWTSHNIELLRRRHRKIRRFVSRHNLHYKGPVTIDLQVCQKLNIYQKFRIICATFSMLYAMAVTLATFLHEYTFLRALTYEVPELLVYISIGLIFRLRNFEDYENIELVPPRENCVVFELPDVCHGQVDPNVVLGLPMQFKVEKETQTPRRRWRSAIR